VPFGTVSTYAHRPDLSKELDEKLARQNRTQSSRAVAVIGLGGTGKTQLVLHYIEEHEAEYDTVLWIDARDKETARASFERCCRALGLPVEPSSDDRPLQDVPCVQAVLTLLRVRAEDRKWLTVIDNADDLSWDISSIVPRGKAGTVLLTSQDGQASRLLGGRTPTIKVDSMRLDEAVHLMSNHLGEPIIREDCYWDLVEKITEGLDRLALPLDLAGARISVDAENWGDLTTALKQYLEDYQHNQERLLHDTEYANATPYKKTAWTAWETSLSSLRAEEESQSDIYPVQLLAFLTLFDRANVQDELFRLASLGLDEACYRLGASVPSWLGKLLERDCNDEWVTFLYRDTIACLVRYGLVKPINTPWKGVTMHSLVQKRARQELSPGHWQWHMVFLCSICDKVNEVDHVRFRRYVPVHLPPSNTVLTGQPSFRTERQMMRLWASIGDVWNQEGRTKEAVRLYVKAADVMEETFGEKDLRTLALMSHLAQCYLDLDLNEEAKVLNSKVLQLLEAELGPRHPMTLTNRHQLTSILMSEGRWEEAAQQQTAILETRKASLGNHDRDTLSSMTTLANAYLRMGKLSRAQELQTEAFETQERLFGRGDPDTINSMGALADIYTWQGKYPESESLHLEAVQATKDLYGDDNDQTLWMMRKLGMSYTRQGKSKQAEELQIEILERSEKIYGRDHLKTLRHMADLAVTRVEQGKLVEAEKMMFEVVEKMTSVLGEGHPDTLTVMSGLAVTLLRQRRWKESGDLGSKVVANCSRALGENHPQTLLAMANLAHAKRGLGQNNAAVYLMKRSAAASSEVLGGDHPDTKARRDQAEEWSSMDVQRIEDVDVSGLQSMRLS